MGHIVLEVLLCCFREYDLIHQTGERVFHRDIQTPRSRVTEKYDGSGVFLTRFEVSG